MMKTRRTVIGGAMLLLAVAAIAAVVAMNHRPVVPEVNFIGVRGEQAALSGLRGKVVLVNFWATTCAICLREMPEITRIYEKYRAQGFDTVAVAMSYDLPDRVHAYAEQTRLPFFVALDIFGKVERAFGGVRGTPTTFLLDRRGRIVWRVEGEPDFGELGRRIERALGEG